MAKVKREIPVPSNTLEHTDQMYEDFKRKLLDLIKQREITLVGLRQGLQDILRQGDASQVRLAHLFASDRSLSEEVIKVVRGLADIRIF